MKPTRKKYKKINTKGTLATISVEAQLHNLGVMINERFATVYNDLNDVIDSSIGSDISSTKKDSSGKPGDIRVSPGEKDIFYLEIKTDDGWVQSTNTTASGFKLKESE